MIVKRKIFNVTHCNGYSKIFISKHEDSKDYYGGILFYNKKGTWRNQEDITLNFELEQFMDTDQNKLYNKCYNWIENNLGDIKEIKQVE